MDEAREEAAIDVLLREHAMLREEIRDRLRTAFTHLAYAGAIFAFWIPLSEKLASGTAAFFGAVCMMVALFALASVAMLNIRWVQHLAAYLRAVEHRVNVHFGTHALGWEHYAETIRAGNWWRIPAPPSSGLPDIDLRPRHRA